LRHNNVKHICATRDKAQGGVNLGKRRKAMSETMDQEREIMAEIDEKAVWRFNHVNEVEEHIGNGDSLLRSIMDTAKQGIHELMSLEIDETIDRVPVIERFEAVIDLIENYRQRNHGFIETLSAKRTAGKAS